MISSRSQFSPPILHLYSQKNLCNVEGRHNFPSLSQIFYLHYCQTFHTKKSKRIKCKKAENNNKRRENSLPDIPFDSFYRQQCLHTHMSERAMVMMKVMNPFTYFHTLIISLTHFRLFSYAQRGKKRLKNIFSCEFQPPSKKKKKRFKT